jgi:hypothetical protein
VFEEKPLRNDGTGTARPKQADQDSKERDEKNHQMAHRRMVARRGILRNHGRNNNSPPTGTQNTSSNTNFLFSWDAEIVAESRERIFTYIFFLPPTMSLSPAVQ